MSLNVRVSKKNFVKPITYGNDAIVDFNFEGTLCDFLQLCEQHS